MNLIENYTQVRKYTLQLCENLQPEDFTPQSALFTSPPKWHIAHTTWFFEQLILKQFNPKYKLFDESYNFLFNSYYNSLGERIQRGERGLITRPATEKIFEYRKYVDDQIVKFLTNTTVSKELNDLIILGINHEQQHQELLLTDLKYTFSRNPLYPKFWDTDLTANTNKSDGWINIEEGIYTIGHQEDSFCFDNELGVHRVFIETFQISKALVTNKEYIEFIEAGGYTNAHYWLDEGWSWVQQHKISKPLYWKQKEGQWLQYSLSGLVKIEPEHILSHISFYEAAAFANWKNCRLATEFEWEVAAEKLDWGTRWEWTNSAYLPYPNFKIAEGSVGEYNGKFMMNQMVLRGASVATSKGHSRHTYRNFFHAEARWQFSGIRLAKQL